MPPQSLGDAPKEIQGSEVPHDDPADDSFLNDIGNDGTDDFDDPDDGNSDLWDDDDTDGEEVVDEDDDFTTEADASADSERADRQADEGGDGQLLRCVEIDLTFEVGEVSVGIHTLRTLRPGYTFELATPIASPVAIKAYGQLVGHGELIQIENRLGVRLLEVCGHER